MEQLIKIILALTIGLLLSSFNFQGDADTCSLTVEVNDLQNSTGNVQFTLYNTEGSIPDEHYEKYYKQLKVEIINNSSSATFTNLPKGIYAVNVLHDENEDGQIKKGWILPIEGIGFSNLQSINPLNRPSFKKAKFEINTNKTIQVKIIYM